MKFFLSNLLHVLSFMFFLQLKLLHYSERYIMLEGFHIGDQYFVISLSFDTNNISLVRMPVILKAGLA